MLHGIDVSHWQRFDNYSILNERSQAFVFIKATEGVKEDRSYRIHRDAFAKTALAQGAYHFLRFNSNYTGLQQAQAFINTVGPSLGAMTLPPVLDIEDVSENISPAAAEDIVRQWLTAVEAQYKVKPIIYTGAWYWNDAQRMNSTPAFKEYPLWVSAYTRSYPPPFGGWQKPTIWQYSGSGTIDGLAGNKPTIDLNQFEGDMDDFWGMLQNVPATYAELGTKIYAVQQLLKKKVEPGLSVDGTWGQKSLAALNKWQDSIGLSKKATIDAGHWNALFDLNGKQTASELDAPAKVGTPSFPETGSVTAELLNIRQAGGVQHALVASPLPKGKTVTVVEEANGWYKVKTQIEGWVSKTHIQLHK